MRVPAALFVCVLSSICGWAQDSLEVVEENGPRDQCINIVFLSEGYTNADMLKFTDDVKEVWSYLPSREPWNRYRSSCNVYRIKVVSNESGIDNGAAGEQRDTYFETEWNDSNGLRISSSGQDRVFSMLNKHVPEYDIIVLLVNDSSHAAGVATGQIAIVSAYPGKLAGIAEHEIGHSFSGLADEYEKHPDGESHDASEKYNVTPYSDRDLVRWKSWIEETTPVLTPENSNYGDKVGVFEGAMYNETGWFRPHYNSMMRHSGEPVGAVNREKLVLSIYEKLGLVISHEPEDSVMDPAGLDEVVFSVNARTFPSGPPLEIHWEIDGVEQLVENSGQFNIAMTELDEGIHTITATVFDPTPWVRDDPDELLKEVIFWTINNGPLTYRVVGSTVTITDCDEAASGTLVIPTAIEGKPVTSIGESAFRDCKGLRSVTIPDMGPNATYVSPGAGWSYRKGNSEPSSPASEWRERGFVEDDSWIVGSAVIGYGDGDDMTVLSDMQNEYSTVYFRKIFSVSADKIPNRLLVRLYIDDGAIVWINGTEVARVSVATGHKGFDGKALTHEASWEEILVVDAGKLMVAGSNVIAVHGLNRSSGSSDFSFDLELRTPPVMSSIADSAFRDCTSLTSITVPDGVTSIGKWSFAGCSSLTSINIPDGVTSIEAGAFSYCASLTSITVPNGVTSIGTDAFYQCTSLTSITIPDSVTSIGDFAFYECTNLTSVVIPDSVTNIKVGVFAGCTDLTSITFTGNSVTSIGGFAFYGCTGLTSVTIPDSVTSIGDSAFRDCTGLADIIFLGNAPSLGPVVFMRVADDAWVTYPSGATGYVDPFGGVRSKSNLSSKEEIDVTSITYNAETGILDIIWNSDFGKNYRVDYSTDLKTWSTLKKLIIGQGETAKETFSVSEELGFFRVLRE